MGQIEATIELTSMKMENYHLGNQNNITMTTRNDVVEEKVRTF